MKIRLRNFTDFLCGILQPLLWFGDKKLIYLVCLQAHHALEMALYFRSLYSYQCLIRS